jgi:hypothetical protein
MMYLRFVVNTEHSKLDCESVMLKRLDVESKALWHTIGYKYPPAPQSQNHNQNLLLNYK